MEPTNDLRALITRRSTCAGTQAYLLDAQSQRRVSYEELSWLVEDWDRSFDRLGVSRGERIGLAVADPLHFACLYLCIVASGRWATPLDPTAPEGVLARSLGSLNPRLVLADRPSPSDGDLAWVQVSPDHRAEAAGIGAPAGSPTANPSPAPSALPPDGGVILASSGTTGTPKIIGLGQSRLMHTARMVADHHGLGPSDRCFNPLPLFHINAEVVGLLACLVSGGSIVLENRFHRFGFWGRVAASEATWVNAVPAIIARLASPAEQVATQQPPPGVRFVRSASAPLPLSVLERFERLIQIPIVETYGMTEAGSQICANPVVGERRPGSVGRPIGVELRIRAQDGIVGVNQIGVIEIRGPGVIEGYLSPDQDHRFGEDGWLVTGDLGSMDEDGYVFLAGRSDDVINRGGEKMFPREIEEVILDDERVTAAVVVGHPDPVLGQVPVAYLVLGRPCSASTGVPGEIIEDARGRCEALLSRPARPVSYHLVSELPVGSTGKVQRHRLVTGSTPAFSLAG